ncbi:hlyD secretion family protein [Synechococcus sp. WH 8103]|uniref:Similar to leukotoxin secretion protein n=1 Tax=Parasynechococcus marenigrum (strain WH8102) TaxID=84588 RepID=Q7U7M3_PARMW|nr:HlyD family efflux transporter periplasmic adaptor subunit [Parasynechococcus marenigrum]CAE07473.1 similar to leukotoxin secretion protein [Parasynechococcus marenigrum WH 8102]CRY91828.1 hlyD secretion family protein [Synechococcus sp. WH 8103]
MTTSNSNSPKTNSSLAVRPLNHQEVQLRPAPLWSKALAWTIISTASLGFIFAVFAKIDEVVLAPGELQPLGAERPVKAPFGGVIKDIVAKEGQKVNAGDTLLRFDADVSRKRKETLETQIKLERKRFEEESRAVEARKRGVVERLNGINRSLNTESSIYTNIIPLAEIGAMQLTELLRQRNKVEQLESEAQVVKADLEEVEAQLNKLKQESLREISELERQMVEVQDTITKEKLSAPIAGIVYGMIPSSAGYAASAGETLVKVVPGGEIEAKIYITNQDVGFMKPGMKAQIRVDAFPYTQFGSITGSLKSVGTLPLEPDQQNPMPRFPAYVKIDKDYLEKDGEKYEISAGQSVQVNLILRDKRVISLLTDAVQKALDSLTRIKSSK